SDGASNDAGLFVFEAGNVAHDLNGVAAGQQRDAIVGFLTMKDCVVASFLDGLDRKGEVFAFKLLQAKNVRLVFGQPVEHVGQADLQGVDVPTDDLHAGTIPLWRNRASALGSRPRKALNDSAAGRLPPTERISRQKRSPVAGSSTVPAWSRASSKASK